MVQRAATCRQLTVMLAGIHYYAISAPHHQLGFCVYDIMVISLFCVDNLACVKR